MPDLHQSHTIHSTTSQHQIAIHGRHHVTRDEIEALAYPVLRHRIVPTFNAEAEGVSVDHLIARLLKEIPATSKQLL